MRPTKAVTKVVKTLKIRPVTKEHLVMQELERELLKLDIKQAVLRNNSPIRLEALAGKSLQNMRLEDLVGTAR